MTKRKVRQETPADEEKARAVAKAEEEKAAEQRRRDTEEKDAAKARKKAEVVRQAKALANEEAAEKQLPRVAAGCSLTSNRGVLGPGEYVYPRDVPGGQETIDARIKTGHIVAGK